MDTSTTVSIALIVAIIAVVSQIYSIYTGHRKNQDDDKRKEIDMEKHFVKLDVKIDQLQETNLALLKNQEAHAVRMEKLSGELIQTNEKIATLFKYKDDHEQRLKALEKSEKK